MSDVSRNDSGRGARPGLTGPSGLAALLSGLKGPKDFWDRPDGDWGLFIGRGAVERRLHANSCYRLGSKALRSGGLDLAERWLRRARAEHHPGAASRLAVVLARRNGQADGADRILSAVTHAAWWGHSDSARLLREAGWSLQELGITDRGETAALEEDPEFLPDVRAALAAVPAPRAPQPANTPAAAGNTPARRLTAQAARPEPQMPPTAQGSVEQLPGRSRLWSPGPLRPAYLTGMAQQAPAEPHSPKRWESALRVLDVLDAISGAGQPISAEQISRTTGLPHQVLEQLLFWLCEQRLTQMMADGGFTPGPVLLMMSGTGERRPEGILKQALAWLRDAAGAAVYIGTYTGGEVAVCEYEDSPATPKVHEWVDFRASAHASALGKSLLAQLDFERRMDHLARHRTVRLTSRTITDHQALFHSLDQNGPHAPQFDLLEYSTAEFCVALPLGVAGEAGCVALSLPVSQRHRLLEAARILSSRSASLLLSVLLASAPPSHESGGQDATTTSSVSGLSSGRSSGSSGNDRADHSGTPLCPGHVRPTNTASARTPGNPRHPSPPDPHCSYRGTTPSSRPASTTPSSAPATSSAAAHKREQRPEPTPARCRLPAHPKRTGLRLSFKKRQPAQGRDPRPSSKDPQSWTTPVQPRIRHRLGHVAWQAIHW